MKAAGWGGVGLLGVEVFGQGHLWQGHLLLELGEVEHLLQGRWRWDAMQAVLDIFGLSTEYQGEDGVPG